MVGYNPLEKVQLSLSDHAFSGAVSGAVTRAVCQPLDVLKIRFQLQIEPINKSEGSTYHGLSQAVRRIIQEEGIVSLWKGHVPAQFLSIFYGVVQYGSFEFLTQNSWSYLPESLNTSYRPLTHTVCGAISGSLASASLHPADVIRTRFVAQGEPKIYKSSLHACRSIFASEGLKGFYRGLVPALALIGPNMGFQFGLYSLFNSIWDHATDRSWGDPRDSVQTLVCGTGSGVVAKLMVYPLDVIKKRLQVQGFEAARKQFGAVRSYSGPVDCLMCIIREEGARGLYKGLYPSLLKSGAVAGLNLCIYELVRKSLISHRSQDSS